MKKAGIGVLVLITGVAIWYFGIKPADYQVTFQVNGTPQATYYHILKWNSWGETVTGNIRNMDSILFNAVEQKVVLRDTVLQLNWSVEALTDSITEVKVAAYSGKHSMTNKLALLTGETPFTKSIKKELKKFRSAVNSFAKTYKVVINGISEAPGLSYLYITDTVHRNQKASKMIAANIDVYPVIGAYRVEKDGFPFIKVKTWDITDDQINFDFGFPIRNKDSLPIGKRIQYGKSFPFQALKATFYGNYSNSDQAWFALINYAKQHNISIKNEPLEIFYDNPMQGGEDKDWKAEIFMPLAEGSF